MSGNLIFTPENSNVLSANKYQRLAIAARATATTNQKTRAMVLMSLINTPDFWIQSVASLFAIVNIYLLAQGHIKLGCQIGLFGQIIFIYIFIDANQYPLIATDAILFGIYVKKLHELRHTTYRRIQL